MTAVHLTDEQQAELDDAIGRAVSVTDPGDVVLGYVLIVETLDAETGHRGVIHRVDDGATPWGTLGRLEYAAAVERNAAGVPDDD